MREDRVEGWGKDLLLRVARDGGICSNYGG